jgi:hypothetical protein
MSEWTKTPPTEPGHYWHMGNQPLVMHVDWNHRKELTCLMPGIEEELPLDCDEHEWWGPRVMPPDPPKEKP